MSIADSERFIQLAAFPSAAEAGMARELLENNGIDALLQGANFGGLEPLRLPGAFSEVRLLVPASQLEEARQIYHAFFEAAPSLDDLPPGGDDDD
ncbi:MAG: putative signal transducing protein [Acidobacteriota bacterium]